MSKYTKEQAAKELAVNNPWRQLQSVMWHGVGKNAALGAIKRAYLEKHAEVVRQQIREKGL